MLRALFQVVILVIASTVNSTSVELTGNQYCENQGFVSTYFLMESGDLPVVSFFFQSTLELENEEGMVFEIMGGTRDRVYTYYDFDNLELHDSKKELVHILDSNLPVYRAEREQIYYVDTSSLDSRINFDVKKYNKRKSPLDKHPLFSRIKRKERPILINELSAINDDKPESITESLKVSSSESVNLILRYGIPYGGITLGTFNISNYGIYKNYYIIKFELFDDKKDDLTQEEIEYLETFFCRTKENFQLSFPNLKPYHWFGYNEYLKLAINDLPPRQLFRNHPELFSIGQIICLAFIGFLFLALILGRYSKANKHRKVSKSCRELK